VVEDDILLKKMGIECEQKHRKALTVVKPKLMLKEAIT
jgi:hypothetical protein